MATSISERSVSHQGFMLWFDSKSVQPRVSAADVILASQFLLTLVLRVADL